MKILLVEDDPASAKVASLILRHMGHEVRAVGTAAAGLDAARRHAFEVALVDIVLPDRDGFWVVAQIGRWCPKTRCILVTARDIPEGTRMARELGAGFLSKPLDYQELGRQLRSGDDESRLG